MFPGPFFISHFLTLTCRHWVQNVVLKLGALPCWRKMYEGDERKANEIRSSAWTDKNKQATSLPGRCLKTFFILCCKVTMWLIAWFLQFKRQLSLTRTNEQVLHYRHVQHMRMMCWVQSTWQIYHKYFRTPLHLFNTCIRLVSNVIHIVEEVMLAMMIMHFLGDYLVENPLSEPSLHKKLKKKLE